MKGLFKRVASYIEKVHIHVFCSMYWKGKCEGLHENQENLNKCVNAISEMGKLALKVSFGRYIAPLYHVVAS